MLHSVNTPTGERSYQLTPAANTTLRTAITRDRQHNEERGCPEQHLLFRRREKDYCGLYFEERADLILFIYGCSASADYIDKPAAMVFCDAASVSLSTLASGTLCLSKIYSTKCSSSGLGINIQSALNKQTNKHRQD